MTMTNHSPEPAMKKPQNSYTPPTLDEEVRNRILMEQMPQVRYIARHIHDRLPQHVPIEDLVHAGILGLMDALTKYDEARQVQFKTYAKFRIRGAILDSLRELDWSPRDLRRKSRQVELASARLSPGTFPHRAGDRH
jgi:RNA polymerase sigma factor for flagellar operon FliA